MINKLLPATLLIIGLVVLPTTVLAEKTGQKVEIITMNDAIVFANFSDELPAVINYFTKYSEQEIIDFYRQQYGEATKSSVKRNRLTSYFSFNGMGVRITISLQNKKRQVDVIVN